MSFVETQVTGLVGTLVGKWLSIKPSRTFGGFEGFCSVSEQVSSETQTTDYPIEDGTQGTDHIVRLPDVIQWDVIFPEDQDTEKTFQLLQKLQKTGEPFDAELGLKSYSNLVLTSINVTQDSHWSRTLRAQLGMRQILITSPVATTIPARAKQASPQETGSTAETGKKQVSEAVTKESDLYKIVNTVRGG